MSAPAFAALARSSRTAGLAATVATSSLSRGTSSGSTTTGTAPARATAIREVRTIRSDGARSTSWSTSPRSWSAVSTLSRTSSAGSSPIVAAAASAR
jgi:hypothetical protein